MDSLVRDLRFAVRGLLRTPGFTAAAILALLGLVALAASALPALRAARIDPMAALRSE